VAERFRRHAGNADVVRQELLAETGLKLSLRTVEREVAPLRRQLEVSASDGKPRNAMPAVRNSAAKLKAERKRGTLAALIASTRASPLARRKPCCRVAKQSDSTCTPAEAEN
jgi:hypothetical protein